MRWSPLVSVLTVLAVTSIFEGVFAAPLDVVLKKRAPPHTMALNSKTLKKDSKTYRNTALGATPYTKSGGGVVKTPHHTTPPKGKDAGR